MLKIMPKSHILKYVSSLRFSLILINLYNKEVANTNRLTLKFNYPKQQKHFLTCASVFLDLKLGKREESCENIIKNQEFVINKEFSYQIINNIKVFKIIILIRKFILKFNKKLRYIKKILINSK